MVGNLDFNEINPKINAVISKLNKTYLDEIIPERATIENIAIYIIKKLNDLESLYSVIVWEGTDKFVEILKEEI